jgi:ABC-type antimicrobial peptide transport system permease subunit
MAAAVDPTLQIDEFATLDAVYRDNAFGDRLGSLTIGAVTLSLLLLSAAGLYSLMSFTVAQRRREIGVRSALGAQPGRLLAGIFRRALGQLAWGAAVGTLIAFLVGRYLPITLMGGLDIPGSVAGSAMLMMLIGALAAVGPARRGLRVDPTEALRDG